MTPMSRFLLVTLAALGAPTAAVAGGWLAGALRVPLVEADDALALLVLSPAGLAWLVLVAALVGVVSALLLLAPGLRGNPRVLVPSAIIQLLVFGIAVQGIGAIALAGYLMAFALPLALVVLAVQVVRRYPRLRAVVGVLLLAATLWGILTGTFQPDLLRQLGTNLATGFAGAAGELATILLFTGLAAGWAVLAATALRGTPLATRWTETVVRHRRPLTLVAASGPVPYALARATWLTPWPQFAGPVEVMAPEIRLWGLLLGGAAAVGAVLTVGLIRPWGEVFPRWMPGLAGRPVPVRAAAVPGGIVATLVTLAAVPMLVAMLSADLAVGDKVLSVLLFPFFLWGPALALAVWGYVAHRVRPGLVEGPSTGSGRMGVDRMARGRGAAG
jgi:hypothetical protein